MVRPWKPIVGFEDDFNETSATVFLHNYWHYSFYISAFYVSSVFAIQRLMRDRTKYNLRAPLMMWSLLLAAFSMTGFAITGLHHWPYLVAHGWKRSVCDPIIVQGQSGLWSFLFCLSKAPELVDTYFIVLRKQKLIFLHWYHHVTVFIYCWYSYGNITHAQQWFITMNYFVHSIMYSYYALRASGTFRPPIWINMFITSLQLLQMVVGVWVNVYIFINMSWDPDWYCDGKIETTYKFVYLAFVMYASYFVLFAHFFYSAYLCKKKKVQDERKLPKDKLALNGHGNGVSLTSKPGQPNGHLQNGIEHSSHLKRRGLNESN